MATTQYIGSRYVPVFADPAEWSSTKTYEPLTIVLHEGNSYTSKQYVPVGIDITNETFWAETGNYNAQVEQYRRDVFAYYDYFKQKPFAFDTVADMAQSEMLYENAVCKTHGFHSHGDGGGAWYVVGTTGTPNGHDVIALRDNYVATLIAPMTLVTPEMYGAIGDGVNDDTIAIQKALDSTAPIVLFGHEKTYRATSRLDIGSNTTVDLNGSIVHGDLDSTRTPVFRNKDYGTTGVENIAIMNGTIKGNGATGNVGDQGHAIALFVVNNALIRNIKTMQTCGDGIGARKAENVSIENVSIGAFGRNGMSLTSGTFVLTNVDINTPPITGANPGNYFDSEINSSTEHCSITFNNCYISRLTFVDFYSPEGATFPFDLHFNGLYMLSGEYGGLTIRSTNNTIATNVKLENMKLVGPDNSAALTITKVAGIEIDGVEFDSINPAASNANAIAGYLHNCIVRNIDVTKWTSGGRGIRCGGGIIDTVFENVKGQVYGGKSITGCTFKSCELTNLLVDSDGVVSENTLIDTVPYYANAIPNDAYDYGIANQLYGGRILSGEKIGASSAGDVITIPLPTYRDRTDVGHTYLVSVGQCYQGRKTHTAYYLLLVVIGSNSNSVEQIFNYGDKTMTFELDVDNWCLKATLETNYASTLSYAVIG